MKSLLSSITLLLGLTLVACQPSKHTGLQPDKYVVVLSCDGFRHDYINRVATPAIHEMIQQGLHSGFTPCFPSVTFPNHYSMATGLYPEHHGLVKNTFYDDSLQLRYSIGDRKAVENPAFYFGEPIWNTAERQGVKSASFYWVGSETPISGHQPSIWKKYDGRVTYTARADSVLSWLSLPAQERPHLIMWYIDEPDHTAHRCGIDSIATIHQIQRADSTIGHFLRGLRSLPIADKVDFIVVSDHGMANYYPDKYVNLYDYLPRDSFSFVADGVPTLLYVKDTAYIATALEKLSKVPHIKAYRTADVPARFHFNKGRRIGDIVVIPDLGTMLQFRKDGKAKFGGMHGYDNRLPEMEALFVAVGPDFKAGSTHAAVPNITLYPLICKILGLQAAPNDADATLVDQLILPTKKEK